MTNSKGKATKQNDLWLTPPDMIKCLGKFNMDVCCPDHMPWITANKMITEKEDGLKIKWKGRVWCNPPYSKILPWVEKMNEHHNGYLLTPAKSTDAVWGHTILQTADAILFLKDRISFYYADGTQSIGKWSPYILSAYGDKNVKKLFDFAKCYKGTIMKRIDGGYHVL